MVNEKFLDLKSIFIILAFSLVLCNCQKTEVYDVIIVGDGTGAITAAIQSARSGANTALVKKIPWLGGMLSSAGVSAIDGNHQLPAGIWGEFRDSVYLEYGGPDRVATGWVSNTHFEPHVGNRILQNMAANEDKLTIIDQSNIDLIIYENGWTINDAFKASILVDGTDLGDIAAKVGVEFDVGMEDDDLVGFGDANVIQDLTYCAILEETSQQNIVERSNIYDPTLFNCACEAYCENPTRNVHPCETMLNYAKLPNNKYLVNWPINGNDYYTNVIDLSAEEREIEFEKAKVKTLDFIHFIQTELGFNNLQIANDEFPSEDGLALMPYHREGRRIKGIVRFHAADIKSPNRNNLYKTGIAVGNYPIDHHHLERPEIIEPDYPAVPSYSIPLGALIPEKQRYFIIADKAISVSNIANGTTRLQPVIMQVGQVAGLLAAKSALSGSSPENIDIREIQSEILAYGGYISPFKDVPVDHPNFKAAQRVAACGLIDLEEKPYKWANETLFHPDSLMHESEIPSKILEYFMEKKISLAVTRLEYAVLVDKHLDPFKDKINHFGNLMKK